MGCWKKPAAGHDLCYLVSGDNTVSFVTSANANVSVMAGHATKNITSGRSDQRSWYQRSYGANVAAAMAYIIATIGMSGLKAHMS